MRTLQRACAGVTLMPMSSALSLPNKAQIRNVVEEIYRQFAAPTPVAIEGCPCCVATRGVDVLLTTSLRDLTGQALWRYVSGVFYTVGSVQDFRYFLPRILEIAIDDPENSIDAEIVLGKVGLAKWQSWSQGEQDAIKGFVEVWFDRALGHDLLASVEGTVGWETEGILCGAARAGFPLAPWLARLREPVAAPVLADLKERFPNDLSGFWQDAPAGLKELAAYLTE